MKMENIGEEQHSKKQECTSTLEYLERKYSHLSPNDDCPECRKLNHRCLIGSHRSETTSQAQGK